MCYVGEALNAHRSGMLGKVCLLMYLIHKLLKNLRRDVLITELKMNGLHLWNFVQNQSVCLYVCMGIYILPETFRRLTDNLNRE